MPNNNSPLIKTSDLKCSPKGLRNFEKYGSCMSDTQLKLIGHTYNAITKQARHKIPQETFKDVVKLRKAIDKKMESSCGKQNEKCWLTELSKKESSLVHLMQTLYRPDMPDSWYRNSREWLSTIDINNVMQQYALQYEYFTYLGTHPIDFKKKAKVNTDKCVYNSSLCSFNVFDFMSSHGKTDCGMVINLSEHYDSGSHWVALYVCLNPNSKQFGAFYYDSTGHPPSALIIDFLKEIYQDARLYFDRLSIVSQTSFPKKFKVMYNIEQHQYKNTECGMFSMLFLILCLENVDKPLNQVNNFFGKHFDDHVHSYRQHLYSTKKTSNNNKSSQQ